MNSAPPVPFSIRPAVPGDEGAILALLGELAAYEKLTERFTASAAAIRRDMLEKGAVCGCVLGLEAGAPAAIATWLWTYKSFRARRGLFVEDLYVRPQSRGKGHGRALLAHLAARAREAGAFLEWQVLDWNAPAIAFYESLGAERAAEWITCRLDGAALERLAR